MKVDLHGVEIDLPDSFDELDSRKQIAARGYFEESIVAYDMLKSWGVPEEDAKKVLPRIASE